MGRTSSAVKQRYNQKAYDEIKLRVPKGQREVIKEYCDRKGESVNSLVYRLIQAEIERTRREET